MFGSRRWALLRHKSMGGEFPDLCCLMFTNVSVLIFAVKTASHADCQPPFLNLPKYRACHRAIMSLASSDGGRPETGA